MGKKGMKGFMKVAQRPGQDAEEEQISMQISPPPMAMRPDSEAADQSNESSSTSKEAALKKDVGGGEHGEEEEGEEEDSGPETRAKMLKRHQREMQAHKKSIQRSGKKSKDELTKLNKEIEDRHAKEVTAFETAANLALPPKEPPSVDASEPLMAKLAISGPDDSTKTKAMKRREKLEREEAERVARIAEESASQGPSDKILEEERLQQLLRPLGLSMKDIKTDGNCLFRSIEDQMAAISDGEGQVMSHSELRRAAANYILEHPDDFMPFIFDEDEKGDEAAQLKSYAETMANTAAWGGQCELVAIAELLQRRIEVHAVGIPVLTLGEHQGKPPLRVCYLRSAFALGEHYNSTTKLEEDIPVDHVEA